MENSHIEWTNHTFNPWWGCMKVSEGCKNCYAESLDNRYHHEAPHWGPGSHRKPMSEAYWNQPLKWNTNARKAGTPAKVFCASMADIFEDHPDVILARGRLFELIEQTPWLIWQLLTKRPENISKLASFWFNSCFPDNVWIGTTVENQEAADIRIPILLRVPAKVRFLSCEPLLGPLHINYIEAPDDDEVGASRIWPLSGRRTDMARPCQDTGKIHWVISGGESGPNSRPMHPDWVRSLRDQCKVAAIPFFFKQHGDLLAKCQVTNPQQQVRGIYFQSPNNPEKKNLYFRPGKKDAGALLDGVAHKEFPL